MRCLILIYFTSSSIWLDFEEMRKWEKSKDSLSLMKNERMGETEREREKVIGKEKGCKEGRFWSDQVNYQGVYCWWWWGWWGGFLPFFHSLALILTLPKLAWLQQQKTPLNFAPFILSLSLGENIFWEKQKRKVLSTYSPFRNPFFLS